MFFFGAFEAFLGAPARGGGRFFEEMVVMGEEDMIWLCRHDCLKGFEHHVPEVGAKLFCSKIN